MENWEEQKLIIDESLATELNNRCFMDLDMPDRIECIKFIKTDKGIGGLYIGCNYYWGYANYFPDDYGVYKIKDTFNGTSITMIKEKSPLLVEISLESFDEMNREVNAIIEESKMSELKFKDKRDAFIKTALKKYS